ncbi:MAG TPA: hypothetical protein VGD83_01180 [Streptosporangiaceae bacterium]
MPLAAAPLGDPAVLIMDEPLKTSPRAGGAQHAQRALPGADDQLAGIARLGGQDGRGDVVDLLAPGGRPPGFDLRI